MGKPRTAKNDGAERRNLAAYLRDIRSTGNISKTEIMDAFVAYRSETNEKRKADLENYLFAANLPLVVFFLKRWFKISNPYALDLIQEGNLGLKRAIQKFDPARKIKFSAYASNWIWVMMNKQHRLLSTAASRVPAHIPFRNLPKDLYFDYLEDTLPNGIDPVEGGVGWLARTILVDEQTPEQLTDEYRRRKAQQELVAAALKRLTPRERSIIQARLMPDVEDRLTLEILGGEFDRSRERIRQLERLAIEKLRKFLAAKGVTDLHNLV